MNEQVASQVISQYAIENANLRLALATKEAEITTLKTELEEMKNSGEEDE